MSYLDQPRVFFSGTFRADPSTVNNTPDNYNPNNNFPPDNGDNVGNNIQLYWNPNGTGEFSLDCAVTKVCDESGTALPDDPLLGQPLVSAKAGSVLGAKLVDLDPMQQNVTELWGLTVQIGADKGPSFVGDFEPSAYSNAWVQVMGGRGDYAGSALYQSVLKPRQSAQNDTQINASPTIQAMLTADGRRQNRLSISFVLRAFNSSSLNYLINGATLEDMNKNDVPPAVTSRLAPIGQYNQKAHGSGVPGQIPTTSYFKKLVSAALTADEFKKYWDLIQKYSIRPYVPATEFDFTYGQVFGVIGASHPGEPKFMTAHRVLTPLSATTDTAAYDSYFTPLAFNASNNSLTVNLGNSLPSSMPASAQNSHVSTDLLGDLQLCYFDGDVNLANAVMLGEIRYQDNDFYLNNAGLATLKIENQHVNAVKTKPLGIISTTVTTRKVLLQENVDGYYLRANQFVFRMNPGTPTTEANPRGETQDVEICVRQFGQPVAGKEIAVSLIPSVEAAQYAQGTLGTGPTSGLANMSVPESALTFPPLVKTDSDGIARFTISATDPGAPRGYIDGQIYFLSYGFSDPTTKANYVQSPDDLISIQIYGQEPNIETVTWDNFVKNTLGLYGKLYAVMGFLDLQNEQSVIDNAQRIQTAINREFGQGNLMPVTRDLSSSRLRLLNAWLSQKWTPKPGQRLK